MMQNRRMTLTAAFACALSSTVLYPLFQGTAWFYAGLGAIITVAACGALSRIRALPVAVCLAISVAGLLLYLNLVFEVRHSWALVIPTPGSLSRLFTLVGTGFADSRRYASPAQELPGLILIAAGGIGITAILTDLIAVRLRSTALAGLPLLVLFTVPVTMNAQHEGLGTALVFCVGTAGYLAMLSADGRERIRVWGRLVSLWRSGSLYEAALKRGQRSDGGVHTGTSADGDTTADQQVIGREPGPDTRALAAAGRRVGLASVILALCVPLIVPGLHSSKLLSSGPGIGGSGGSAPTIALPDTLSQTLHELQQKNPLKLLTYTLSGDKRLGLEGPPYLQAYVYDNLTDTTWTDPSYTANEQQATTMRPPEGLNDQAAYPQFKISVTVANHALTNPKAPTFLAVPYPVTQVSNPPGVWLVDPELMVFSQDPGVDVHTYQATSMDVAPSGAQLRSAPRLSSSQVASLSADLALPDSYKKLTALKQIAQAETRGQPTEFDKVDALASWLSSGAFNYKANAPAVNSADTLLTFLQHTRAGVCVQSAWAMTVLTRLLGIPARLAGGFTGGTRVSGTTYKVTTDDAHAWAEVYFNGYGWIKFEATPGGGDGSARAGTYQTSASNSGLTAPPPLPIIQPSGGPTANTPGGVGGANKLLPDTGGSGGSLAIKASGTPWAAVALAIVAAIALACGVITIVSPPAHRIMSAHSPDAARRRRPGNLASVVLVAVAVAIVALALYRLLSHTSGLNLRAGWATVGIAFGAACGFMFVAPGVIRIVARRWRWLRAGDDASRAHAAWRQFRDDLQDLGLGCAPSEPPRTLADRVSCGLPDPAREAVRRIALAEERASYAARPSGSAELRRDAAAARRGLASSVRRGNRWRARIFPASVMTAVADGAARIPDRLAALISRRWTERRSTS